MAARAAGMSTLSVPAICARIETDAFEAWPAAPSPVFLAPCPACVAHQTGFSTVQRVTQISPLTMFCTEPRAPKPMMVVAEATSRPSFSQEPLPPSTLGWHLMLQSSSRDMVAGFRRDVGGVGGRWVRKTEFLTEPGLSHEAGANWPTA